jgi:hypothetical protein
LVALASVIAYALVAVHGNDPGTTTTGPNRVSWNVRVTATVPPAGLGTCTVTVRVVIRSVRPS